MTVTLADHCWLSNWRDWLCIVSLCFGMRQLNIVSPEQGGFTWPSFSVWALGFNTTVVWLHCAHSGDSVVEWIILSVTTSSRTTQYVYLLTWFSTVEGRPSYCANPGVLLTVLDFFPNPEELPGAYMHQLDSAQWMRDPHSSIVHWLCYTLLSNRYWCKQCWTHCVPPESVQLIQ